MWKGEDVGYNALHDYIKYHLPKPDICGDCNSPKKLELANISGEYKRDLTDWEWICRRCHMLKDGRLIRLNVPITKILSRDNRGRIIKCQKQERV